MMHHCEFPLSLMLINMTILILFKVHNVHNVQLSVFTNRITEFIILIWSFLFYFAVTILGFDRWLPGTPSSSAESNIHFRFCLKNYIIQYNMSLLHFFNIVYKFDTPENMKARICRKYLLTYTRVRICLIGT
jgi:hypothetical protein